MEKQAKTTLSAAREIVNSRLNCTPRTSAASKLIKLITPEKSLVTLGEFLASEQIRLAERFSEYYGYDVIEAVDFLINYSDDKEYGFNLVMSELRTSEEIDDFNWENYRSLLRYNKIELMSVFDTNFRGDIKAIHAIYDHKYTIIETLESTRLERSINKRSFYAVENLSVKINVFDDFESCLFSLMFGDKLSKAVSILYDSTKTNTD